LTITNLQPVTPAKGKKVTFRGRNDRHQAPRDDELCTILLPHSISQLVKHSRGAGAHDNVCARARQKGVFAAVDHQNPFAAMLCQESRHEYGRRRFSNPKRRPIRSLEQSQVHRGHRILNTVMPMISCLYDAVQKLLGEVPA
jgi:hypothetical protein